MEEITITFSDEQVLDKTKEVTQMTKNTVLQAINLGEMLTAKKEEKQHGEWYPFLEWIGLPKRTASLYMSAYSNKDNYSDGMTITELSSNRQIGISADLKEQIPLPKDKYSIVYADPPWKYNDAQNTKKLGGALKHYPLMTIKELCDMDIQSITNDNAVLFLWVTSPLLEESFDIISDWGFKYKTSFVWDKVKHNMGHYNSVRHEFLLVCTKGSYTPQVKKLFDSVQSIERTEKHSQKPEEFRTIIDTIYPNDQRIELFARKETENWEVYGNEVL